MAESGQNKFRAYTTGARKSNNPDVGWVLKAAYASQIGRTITAPVTEESRDFRLPVIHAQLLFLTLKLVRFAHNWNVGILECWNNGFCKNGILAYWEFFLNTQVANVKK